MGVSEELFVKRRIGGSLAPTSSEFSTTFGTDENPLSETGIWTQPNVSGFFNVQAVGGIACGTTASDTGYPDCYCFHAGYTGDYEVEAGIFKSGSINTGINHEVELHICMSQDGTEVLSIEWLVNQGGSGQVMKWDGINDGVFEFFSPITLTSGTESPGACNNGNRMKLRKQSGVGIMYWDSGGGFSELGRFNLPHTTGHPGMAFFVRGGGNVQHLGFTDYIIRPL